MNQSLMEQSEKIEKIVSDTLKLGAECRLFYVAGDSLPFKAQQGGWIGHGDSITESMAQLASKLVLP